MINVDVTAGNFFYCVNHWFPHQSKTFCNEIVTDTNIWHQYSYVIDGSCVGEFRDAEDGKVLQTIRSTSLDNSFLDHSGLPKYETVTTDEEGVTMMFFCPINNSKPIQVEIKNEGTHTVKALGKRVTIVSIVGPVTANGKELISMQYATVFTGNSAELVVPKNGVCALVSYA
jgi:hypothetical protein